MHLYAVRRGFLVLWSEWKWSVVWCGLVLVCLGARVGRDRKREVLLLCDLFGLKDWMKSEGWCGVVLSFVFAVSAPFALSKLVAFIFSLFPAVLFRIIYRIYCRSRIL
ncbi:hypothetical protein DL98DRAFT_142145 [Cadophora sp. DSE1049]|nr:hypothetical protein DL98DRAFT_142145 [Cadophora sp. DSE1049]